jgi:hypothetical protein
MEKKHSTQWAPTPHLQLISKLCDIHQVTSHSVYVTHANDGELLSQVHFARNIHSLVQSNQGIIHFLCHLLLCNVRYQMVIHLNQE